jgi:hypothetical protein
LSSASYLPVRYLLIPILLVASLLPVHSFSQAVPGQHPEEFQGTFARQVQMKYLLCIPEEYKDNERKIGRLSCICMVARVEETISRN